MFSSEPAVEVQDFTKKYQDFVAVDRVTFAVGPGEIFGLLGPNGAGKTSTLECLEGLRVPDAGRLRVGGVDPSVEFHKLKNVIGVQLQSSALPDSITPREAIRLFSYYHGVEPDYSLLDRLGLAGKQTAQYYQLSTGQQRRLSLALAVMHQPDVLFLDEPTAGLDVATRSVLHQLVRELRDEGTTIILATHDMAEAEELSDRVAILLEGKLAMVGTPLEITATGAGLTKISVRTLQGSLPLQVDTFPAVSHVAAQEEYQVYFSSSIGPTLSALINMLEALGDTLVDLRVERPSLEDRFLEITSPGERT